MSSRQELSRAQESQTSPTSPPKSRWTSPTPNSQSHSTSPPRNSTASPVACPICLGQPENKSFTDQCFHEFCFTCLVEWSKVKAECPLCKQGFNRIIHSVKSLDQYEEYQVPEERQPSDDSMDDPWMLFPWHTPGYRFRYRTTVADTESRRRSAIERRLRQFHYQNFVLPTGPRPSRPRRPRPHTTGNFRRQVYEDSMWSQVMRDVTGNLREASPRFFRENPAMTHRLVPWLNRELSVLVTSNNDPHQIQNLIEMILELIKTHSILSPEFRRHMEPHVGRRAKHFQHEFYTFARSPFDVTGYDQHVQFVRREEEESDNSGSEIEVLEEISPSRASATGINVRNDLAEYMPTTSVISRVLRLLSGESSPQPGPSGAETGHRSQSPPSWNSSDSDVEVVATLKPKHERTPVLINLSSEEAETPVPRTPTPPPEMKKSKNGERLKRLMRQQIEAASSATSTPDAIPGPSRRRIESSDSDSGSALTRVRRAKKRSYRRSDYDSSDSEFEPHRKTKSPRRISESQSTDSEVQRKKKKKHKRSKEESKSRKGKHKKHKRKKSKERSSKMSDSGSRSHSSKSKRERHGGEKKSKSDL